MVIFESKSSATERLDHMSGIAAILYYPLDESVLMEPS
jgi:stalled ribosome rescue protein Dom34